jgi:DNA modification methylase
MMRAEINHTRRGEAVYDPFMGSGTTLIAAESVGRRALGVEILPAYLCDIAVRRWEAYTGSVALLAAQAEDGGFRLTIWPSGSASTNAPFGAT